MSGLGNRCDEDQLDGIRPLSDRGRPGSGALLDLRPRPTAWTDSAISPARTSSRNSRLNSTPRTLAGDEPRATRSPRVVEALGKRTRAQSPGELRFDAPAPGGLTARRVPQRDPSDTARGVGAWRALAARKPRPVAVASATLVRYEALSVGSRGRGAQPARLRGVGSLRAARHAARWQGWLGEGLQSCGAAALARPPCRSWSDGGAAMANGGCAV